MSEEKVPWEQHSKLTNCLQILKDREELERFLGSEIICTTQASLQ